MSTQTFVQAVGSAEVALSRKALFDDLDARARGIERRVKETWVELAEICTAVRDSELWREGGFPSFGAWLMDSCPTSRSYAYAAMGVRDELAEISTEELKQIPLGNASILSHTPKASRNGQILEDAKAHPPREFLPRVIQSVPEAHLEQRVMHKFRMPASASHALQTAFEMWRFLNDDPEAPVEDSLEGIVVDYMLAHQTEFERKRQQVGLK